MAKKTVDDYIKDLDEFVSKTIKKIPYDRLQVWKDIVFEPNETIKIEMKNASLMRGAKDIAASSFVYMLVIAIYFAEYFGFMFAMILIPTLFMSAGGGLGSCISPLIISVLIAIAIMIALVLLCVIGWLFYSGLEFLLARFFGGKGGYTIHAYLEALSTAAMMAALTPFMLLYLVPCLLFCVGVIAQPFMMLIGLYSIYIRYLIVRQVHELDRNKAIATVLIPPVVIMALVFVLYIGLLVIDIAVQGMKR